MYIVIAVYLNENNFVMNVDYVVPNIDFAKSYSVLKWIATVEGVWKNHQEDIE